MKEKNDTYVTIETLKNMFKMVKEEYQKKFIEMYDFYSIDCYWIENVLYVADYYFDFYDVKFAVDNAIEFEFLNKWCDYSLTVYENFHERITLKKYKTGILPYKEEDIENLQKLQKEKCQIESAIDDLINHMKKTDLLISHT